MIAEFAALAMACAPQVHISTLHALVQAESEGNPYAIGVNSEPRKTLRLKSHHQAVTAAKTALAQGQNIDAGWAQINSANWDWLGLTADTVFDPCTNLRAAQAVLTECYKRALKTHASGPPALMASLSCYNTGNFRDGLANGYVRGVYAQANAPIPAIDQSGLPPVPPPLPGTSPQAPAPETTSEGIADGFDAAEIQDGFTSNNLADGFKDPRTESSTPPSDSTQ
ncbi:lytic transglycosylase domain-containing protein [Castellaniella sp.]|uniref:lytic transglycosylase domain-containing protein n=1 Tax=Castellaniella sp. TaxID=1955812 RepID=UPI002AFE0DD2|nr:lytic transglycosylase domain-containing protein [Castellaniella sp.]